MGKYYKIFVLSLTLLCLIACAKKQKSSEGANVTENDYIIYADSSNNKSEFRNFTQKGEHRNDPRKEQKLINKAHSAIGTPYVLGGTTLGGFDCSGFVKWAYNGIGIQLPRTAREQSVVGKKINKRSDMKAGDIVAFKHPRRGYHTGIYLGNGKFIHSPRKRTRVRINSLDDPYFSTTLLGARRINMASSENLVAQAESRLDSYDGDRSRISIAVRNIRNHRNSIHREKNSVKTVARNFHKKGKAKTAVSDRHNNKSSRLLSKRNENVKSSHKIRLSNSKKEVSMLNKKVKNVSKSRRHS